MKVCVYQVKIGNQTYLDKFTGTPSNFCVFEKKICMPSVKDWAKWCGYDYRIIASPTIKRNNFFSCDFDWYSSEKIMHVDDSKYDFVIYVDSDVYVHKKERFPLHQGLSIVEEKIPNERFSENISSVSENLYYNAGVFSVDTNTAKSIKSFFLNYIYTESPKKMEYAEQDILNRWIVQNGCNPLNDEWNYLMYKNVSEGKNKNFYHFLGQSKNKFEQLFSQIRRIK